MTLRTRIALAAGLLAAALPGVRAARASTPGILVFRVQAKGLSAQTAGRLNKALADGAKAEGLSPKPADATLSDAAQLLKCNVADAACLDDVARTMEARRILAATAGPPQGSGIPVQLTYFQPGKPPVVRDVALPADPDASPAALERITRALLQQSAGTGSQPAGSPATPSSSAKPDSGAAPTGAPAPAPTSAPTPAAPAPHAGTSTAALVTTTHARPRRFSFHRVKTYSWVVAASGAALLGVSTVFAIKAGNLRDQVNQAPRNSLQDFQHLQQLEHDGQRDTSLANGLAITGGLALAAGGALILWQGFSSPERPASAVSMVPVALEGGAGLFVSMELP